MAVRDLVLNNFRWKLTALLLALLLWFVIKYSTTTGRNQVVRQPVMVLKAPDDPRLFRLDPPLVDVVVQSARELKGDDLQTYVDLTRMPDVSSAFKPVLVRAADGVSVVGADPLAVMVERVSLLESSLTNAPSSP